MLNVTDNKKYFFSISIAIMVLGLLFYFINGGLNLDVDYTGGTNLNLDLGEQFDVADIEKIVVDATSSSTDAKGIKPSSIIKGGENGTEVTITIKELSDAQSTAVLNAIREKYDPEYDKDGAEAEVVKPSTEAAGDEKADGEKDAANEESESKFKVFSRETVSATVGKELQRSAFLSSLIAIILMLVYISFRFEFWSGIAAVVSLLQNVLVLLSVYAIFRLKINSTFIAALLTIVGYSINDTIVIFDRIRENNRYAKKETFNSVVNKSVTQSLTRSINTSITTLLSIVILYIIGVPSIQQFALPIIIGIVVGTYSSITIASPIWALFKQEKKKA